MNKSSKSGKTWKLCARASSWSRICASRVSSPAVARKSSALRTRVLLIWDVLVPVCFPGDHEHSVCPRWGGVAGAERKRDRRWGSGNAAPAPAGAALLEGPRRAPWGAVRERTRLRLAGFTFWRASTRSAPAPVASAACSMHPNLCSLSSSAELGRRGGGRASLRRTRFPQQLRRPRRRVSRRTSSCSQRSWRVCWRAMSSHCSLTRASRPAMCSAARSISSLFERTKEHEKHLPSHDIAEWIVTAIYIQYSHLKFNSMVNSFLRHYQQFNYLL